MNGQMADSLYYGIIYAQTSLFIWGMNSGTMPVRKGRKTTALSWGLVTALSFFLGAGVYRLVMDISEAAITASGRPGAPIQLLYMAVTLLQVLLNTLCAVIMILAVLWIYQAKLKTKLFIASLFMLIVAAVSQFITQLTCIFFSPGNDGFLRLEPDILTRSLVHGFWLLLIYLIYNKGFRSRIVSLLETAEEQICHCAVVTGISYLAFELVKETLGTYGITLLAMETANLLIAVIVLLSLLVIYYMMYWAIFRSVIIGAGAARVNAELAVAGNIQASALPAVFPAFPERTEFDIYASMHPAKEVGGDFYDFFFVDEDRLAVLIADVSGKGVPAALFMMSGRAVIRNQAMLGIEPGEIFFHANNQLEENNQEGMFITAFFGILNVKTGDFAFCNAGHNTPYLCGPSGEVLGLPMRPGFVLGGMKGIRYQTEHRTLEKGERLVLYTDGVTEAINEAVEMYTEKRLESVLSGCAGRTVRETVEAVNRSVAEFAGPAEQFDDITVLVVERMQDTGG